MMLSDNGESKDNDYKRLHDDDNCAFFHKFFSGIIRRGRQDQSNAAIHLPAACRVVFSHGEVPFFDLLGLAFDEPG